jgi:hypothetical protein
MQPASHPVCSHALGSMALLPSTPRSQATFHSTRIVISYRKYYTYYNLVFDCSHVQVNYHNRNASGSDNSDPLLVTFIAAVVASLTVSLGLATLVKMRYPSAIAERVLRFAAFPTANVTTTLSCYIMRRIETKAGIELFDGCGRPVAAGARSQVAARKAVYQTIASRLLLTIPGLLMPALITSIPVIVRLTTRRPKWALSLDTLTIMLCFGFGLPATNAAFPRTGSIRASKLEPAFHAYTSSGDSLYYNKGL